MSSQVRSDGARKALPSRRPAVSPGLAMLRPGMRALAWLSPSAAAWALDRLWFRAPRTRPDAAALACLMQGRRHDFLLHGRPVASWEWGGQGPWVVLVHGWGGHAGQLHAFVPALLAAGFRVAAFDAPAHGASGGSRHGRHRVSFLEFADALRAMEARLGPLAGVIPQPEYVESQLHLGPGDALVLYTDGVTEARAGSTFYGDNRLLETVRAHPAGRPSSGAVPLSEAVLVDVEQFQGDDARDDIAVVSLEVPAGPPAR